MQTPTATVNFADLPSIDARAVARAFHRERIVFLAGDLTVALTDSFENVDVSLRKLGRDRGLFSVAALAMLAVLTRKIAESGRRVRILLPGSFRGNRSSVQKLLANFEFANLFLGNSAWSSLVAIDGEIPPTRPTDSPEDAHYVPLRWFDRSWFDVPDGDSDLFTIEPRLRPDADKRLSETLVAQYFLAPDAADLFIRVMFLELGWNSVLHSQRQNGTGYGVVGAQIRHSTSRPTHDPERGPGPTLQFCVADSGLGIPHTLREYYDKSGKAYEQEYRCSRPAAILRSAIDPESSSRRRFPNDLYRASDRGLARVADAVRPSERLEFARFVLSSGPGRLTLSGEDLLVTPIVEDAYAECAVPGVVVEATLSLRRTSVVSPRRTHLADEKELCVVAADATGSEFRRDLTAVAAAVMVIDVAFADSDIREVERIAREAIELAATRLIVLWNVRSQFNQLNSLATWYLLEKRAIALAVVRDWTQAALLTPSAPDTHANALLSRLFGQLPQLGSATWTTTTLDVADYVALTRRINSSYLNIGFRTGGPDQGFFVGAIHLLTGDKVPRYFSLPRNAASDAGLRRWATTCAAALGLVLAGASAAPSEIVVLGLPGAVKDLLRETLELGTLPDLDVFTLMTYDVPTSEEIATVVEGKTCVIFVTDVVSSASLLAEATRIVEKLGKRILGTVALVDARTTRQKDSVPLVVVSGAEFTPGPSSSVEGGREYWVDPISLTPTTKQLFGHATDERVQLTIEALSSSNSVHCGHVVDGQRHMSAYVDVASFINAKESWLLDRVRAECASRLASRRWGAFCPTHVLYPRGIARIDAVQPRHGGATALTSYQTGVGRYLSLLKRLWPGTSELSVPRAFDPAGRPQCARVVNAPSTGRAFGEDAIVADDCLWSGRSAHQLVNLAVTLGARRVLVVPLLARMPQEDLEYWESLRAVTLPRGEAAEVCYAFPAVLPIPHYGGADCPYEITDRRLRRWSGRSLPLEDEEARVRQRLEGKPWKSVPVQSAAYTAKWLTLRAYAELAGFDQGALAMLRGAISSTQTTEERMALLTLFLEDWAPTGRPRLRQSIRPILVNIAAAVLEEATSTSEESIAACSLLRSINPERFVESLPNAVDRLGSNVDFLGRLVLQMSSLPKTLRGLRHVSSALRKIVAHADDFDTSSEGALGANDRLAGLLTTCEQLQFPDNVAPPAVPSSPRAAAAALLDLVLSDPTLTHETWSFIAILATGDNARSYSATTFQRLHDKWAQTHREIIMRQMLPLLHSLEPQLLLTLSKASRIANTQTAYFTKASSSSGPVFADLSGLQFALKRLVDRPGSSAYLKILKTCAQRLHEYALSKESLLVKLLREMQGPTVGQFVDLLRSELQSTSAVSSLSVDVVFNDKALRDRTSFCPAELLNSAAMAVVDNIRRYAFQRSALAPRVLIEVDSFDGQGELGAAVKVFDNGRELGPLIRSSEASKSIRTTMSRFQGVLHPPAESQLPGWPVIQQVDIALWSTSVR